MSVKDPLTKDRRIERHPLSASAILAGLIVTVLGGVAVALITQSEFFSRNTDPESKEKHIDDPRSDEKEPLHIKSREQVVQKAAVEEEQKPSDEICTTPQGCLKSGENYYWGTGGVERDFDRSATLYETACALGSMRACLSLGTMYMYPPVSWREERDYETAARVLQIACQGGEGDGCDSLGDIYYYGWGLKKDYSKAAQYYEEACDLGVDCYDIGQLYENGVGVGKDFRRALELYETGCRRNYNFPCFELAKIYKEGRSVDHDYVKAISLFEKNCSGNHGEACYELGLIYEKGIGVAKDADKAKALFEQACQKGYYAHGCQGTTAPKATMVSTSQPQSRPDQPSASAESLIGREVSVDSDHVVINVDKDDILHWPEDKSIKERVRGRGNLKDGSIGTVLYQTVYSPGDSGYWLNREVFIVDVDGRLIVVPEEGITPIS